jgi:hypothetical protein
VACGAAGGVGGGDEVIARWSLGLAVSLVVGGIVTHLFVRCLRRRINTVNSEATGVSPWLTGMIERLFFTVVVAFDVSGTATAMMGWLAVKMASNWNRLGVVDPPGAFSALLAGLVSLLFALVGGLICRASKPGG